MRDNFSQWDDPRVVGVKDGGGDGGVEDDEVEAVGSHRSEEKIGGTVAKDEYKQELIDKQEVEAQQRRKEMEEEEEEMWRQKEAIQEQNESLKSPTMTSSRRAGVGAMFINTTVPAFVPLKAIHAETKYAPLVARQGEPESMVQGHDDEEDFIEASEVVNEDEEAKTDGAKLTLKTASPEANIETTVAEAKKIATTVADPKAASIERQNPDAKFVITAMSKEKTKSDAILGKYAKMASVGVPVATVLQKLKADGVPVDKFEQFCLAFGVKTVVEEEDEEGGEEGEDLPPILSKEELMEDEDLVKYLKMTKMGIPPPAVAQKMNKDNIDLAKILSFEMTFGLRTAQKKGKKKKDPHGGKRRTTVKMQQIHLNKVSEDRLKGSLWAGGGEDDDLAKGDIAKLEQAFGRQSSSDDKGVRGVKEENKAPKNVSLVDAKRAYNVCISLAQFRGSFREDYDKLINAAVAFDEVSLDHEKVNNLRKILPTENELHSVMSWKGDEFKLGKCERFFRAAGRVDGVSSICEAFCIMLGFTEIVKDIREKLKGEAVAWTKARRAPFIPLLHNRRFSLQLNFPAFLTIRILLGSSRLRVCEDRREQKLGCAPEEGPRRREPDEREHWQAQVRRHPLGELIKVVTYEGDGQEDHCHRPSGSDDRRRGWCGREGAEHWE